MKVKMGANMGGEYNAAYNANLKDRGKESKRTTSKDSKTSATIERYRARRDSRMKKRQG